MTRLHAGALDKYISQQVNHMDILELGSMNAQAFVLNFVQLFVTAFVFGHEVYSEMGKELQWALYIQFAFGLLFGLYLLLNQASTVFVASLVFFGMDLVQFVLFFVLIGNTDVLGVTNKPYIVKWCIINSCIILF